MPPSSQQQKQNRRRKQNSDSDVGREGRKQTNKNGTNAAEIMSTARVDKINMNKVKKIKKINYNNRNKNSTSTKDKLKLQLQQNDSLEDKTLDDNVWKDDFDKLLDQKEPLRRNNVLRKVVRASYNFDSSIESNSITRDNSIGISKELQKNTINVKQFNQPTKNTFLRKKSIKSQKSVTNKFNLTTKKKTTNISTPIAKSSKNIFKLSLSPISKLNTSKIFRPCSEQTLLRVNLDLEYTSELDSFQKSLKNKLHRNQQQKNKGTEFPAARKNYSPLQGLEVVGQGIISNNEENENTEQNKNLVKLPIIIVSNESFNIFNETANIDGLLMLNNENISNNLNKIEKCAIPINDENLPTTDEILEQISLNLINTQRCGHLEQLRKTLKDIDQSFKPLERQCTKQYKDLQLEVQNSLMKSKGSQLTKSDSNISSQVGCNYFGNNFKNADNGEKLINSSELEKSKTSNIINCSNEIISSNIASQIICQKINENIQLIENSYDLLNQQRNREISIEKLSQSIIIVENTLNLLTQSSESELINNSSLNKFLPQLSSFSDKIKLLKKSFLKNNVINNDNEKIDRSCEIVDDSDEISSNKFFGPTEKEVAKNFMIDNTINQILMINENEEIKCQIPRTRIIQNNEQSCTCKTDKSLIYFDRNYEIYKNEIIVETPTQVLSKTNLTDKNLLINNEKTQSKNRKGEQIDKLGENFRNVNGRKERETNLRISNDLTDGFKKQTNSKLNKKTVTILSNMNNIDQSTENEKLHFDKHFNNDTVEIIDEHNDDCRKIQNSTKSIERKISKMEKESSFKINEESVIDLSPDILETRKKREKKLFEYKNRFSCSPNDSEKSTKPQSSINLEGRKMKKCCVRLKRLQISEGIIAQNNSAKVFTSIANKSTESNELIDIFSDKFDEDFEFLGFSKSHNKLLTNISQFKKTIDFLQHNNSSNRDHVFESDTHHISHNTQSQETSNDNGMLLAKFDININNLTDIKEKDHESQFKKISNHSIGIINNLDNEQSSEIILHKKRKLSNEIIFETTEKELCNYGNIDDVNKTNNFVRIDDLDLPKKKNKEQNPFSEPPERMIITSIKSRKRKTSEGIETNVIDVKSEIEKDLKSKNGSNVQTSKDKLMTLHQSPSIFMKTQTGRSKNFSLSSGEDHKNLKYLPSDIVATNCTELNNKLRKAMSKIKKCVVTLEKLNISKKINEKKNVAENTLIPISSIRTKNLNSKFEKQSDSRIETNQLKKINKLRKINSDNSKYTNHQSKNKIEVKPWDKKTCILPRREFKESDGSDLSSSLIVNISSEIEDEIDDSEIEAADKNEENLLSICSLNWKSPISTSNPLIDVSLCKANVSRPNNKKNKMNQEIKAAQSKDNSNNSKSPPMMSKTMKPIIRSPINTNFSNKNNDSSINSNTLLKIEPTNKFEIILPSGKWRRSLMNWKNRIRLDESTNRNSKNINENAVENKLNRSIKFINISFQKKKNINSLAMENISMIKEGQSENDSFFDRNKAFGIRKTLLLESTDDDSPNLRSVSILDKPIEQNNSNGRSSSKSKTFFSELEEENFNVLVVQPESDKEKSCKERNSNEKSLLGFNINSSRQLQHQYSVPVCGNQQFPLQVRCPRTSVVQSNSERGILHESQPIHQEPFLLRDEIICPNLNISILKPSNPRDIVLQRCNQTDPLDFSEVYSEKVLHQCRKIGEGVYGEVFMNKNQFTSEVTVLKIIPIDGTIEVNGERQKNFEQILPEIIIAKELSRLRNDKKYMTSGFVDVKHVCCVLGRYPDHLIDLWELYRDNRGTENDHPEIFPEDQLYIVFELANGGQDLEAYMFENACQAHSAFLQVAVSLAIAESKFQFEHRDLHWGNILLASTSLKEIVFKLNGREIKIPTNGVLATIIDYTLSRVVFQGCCLYNDLADDNELFSATGDYQCEIYRLMRKNVDNDWARYQPFTNVLWLHYIVDKLIDGARYRLSKTKKHRSAVKDLMDLRDDLLNFQSASNYTESLE